MPHEDDIWRLVECPAMVTKSRIVHDAFDEDSLPALLARESAGQQMVRRQLALSRHIRAERYRLPSEHWIRSSKHELMLWMMDRAIHTEQNFFQKTMQKHLRRRLQRPGAAMELIRNGIYKQEPNIHVFAKVINRNWPMYKRTTSNYIMGSLFSKEMESKHVLYNTQPAVLLHSYPDKSRHRHHYVVARILLELFANETHTNVLNDFFLDIDNIDILLSHIGKGRQYTTNVPLHITLDDTYWVIYLDHVVISTHDFYISLLHWLWMVVFVSIYTNQAARHDAFVASIRKSMGFMSNLKADTYLRVDFMNPVPAERRRYDTEKAVRQGTDIAWTIADGKESMKKLTVDDLEETMEKGAAKVAAAHGLVATNDLFG